MRRCAARIEALALGPSGQPVVRLALDAARLPAPGQIVYALKPGSGQMLRRAFFPIQVAAGGFTTDRGPEAGWQPGDSLDLLGPAGRGFDPPGGSRRWLLAAFGRPLDRLLPLVERGLSQGASLAVWAESKPAALPASVEVLARLEDAWGWADYAALEAAPDLLPGLASRLGKEGDWRGGPGAQVLVAPPMPCGLGACQACAVPARRGWKLACSDGPVFDLGALLDPSRSA